MVREIMFFVFAFLSLNESVLVSVTEKSSQ